MPFGQDLALLVVLTVLWGLNWSVMKAGVRDFAPLTFRTLCIAGGVVLMAAMARQQGNSLRIERRHWRELVLLALTNMVIWYVLSIWAVKLLSSGRAAILGPAQPERERQHAGRGRRARDDERTGAHRQPERLDPGDDLPGAGDGLPHLAVDAFLAGGRA